jgi:hypothetical protein
VSFGPLSYAADRLPRVGVPHTVAARIVDRGESHLRVRAVTTTQTGKSCGTLESAWRPASREVIDRAGIPLPDYLLSDIDR